MPSHESSTVLVLSGLDGGNPLAFLAAIGTLRAVTRAAPSVEWTLSWKMHDGHWSPVLGGSMPLKEDSLIELLMPILKSMDGDPALCFADDLTVSRGRFRGVAQDAHRAATLTNRHFADFVGAFGCDSLSVSRKDQIQDTALRTMSGAGHQHFLKFMRDLVQTTESIHLKDSLFAPWRYSDPRPSLRWDPLDDRRHALRWKNPSGDSVQTMRGANRLAIEALPLLATAPGEHQLHTTGFVNRRGEGVLFTWPIWDTPLNVEIVRSLLSLAEIQEPRPNRDSLAARGVVEVYRSQRITVDKYRNFTGAVPV